MTTAGGPTMHAIAAERRRHVDACDYHQGGPCTHGCLVLRDILAAAHETDMGNARRLVARHGAEIRYVPLWDAWYVWTGQRWQRDDSQELERRAKQTVLDILVEAREAESKTRRKELVAHAFRSESDARIRAMIRQASSELELVVSHTQLDQDPWLLNLENGTLDLRTGQLRPHAPRDLITKIVPIAYGPEARCPTWLAFLTRALGGSEEMIGYVQRALGYSLTGITREQCFFFLSGPGGTGKSTFLEVGRLLAGEYARDASIETFLVRKNPSSTSGDLARLAGARFVSASEPAKGRRWDEARLKELTGGSDRVTACFKYEDEFEFTPQFKLWFAANAKPRLWDTSSAMRRRLRLLPFVHQITPADPEYDNQLDQKLRAELPGILRWAVDGCLVWQRQPSGLGTVAEIDVATDEYLSNEKDEIAEFADEHLVRADGVHTPSHAVYERFRRWAGETGQRLISQTKLAIELKELGFRNDRNAPGRLAQWLDVVLSERPEGSWEGLGGFKADCKNPHIHGPHEGVLANGSKPSQPSADDDELGDDDYAIAERRALEDGL